MLVLIGEEWLTPDDGGVRRIDDPNDRLRLEIEAGLRHQTTVIPVLVDAAGCRRAGTCRVARAAVAAPGRAAAARLFRSDTEHLLDAIAGSPRSPAPR